MTAESLYLIHPLRLRRERHDAADKVMVYAARGMPITARSWARIVAEIDAATNRPDQRTRAAWNQLIEDYAAVGR